MPVENSKYMKEKAEGRARFFVQFEDRAEYEAYLKYEKSLSGMKKKALRLKIFQAGMKQIIKTPR